MSAPLLQARGVTKVFRLKSGLFVKPSVHVAVNSIDLELAPRERVGVVGESGSGKSTLGRLLLGLTSTTEGEVLFEGLAHTDRSARDWSTFRKETSLVQQNPLSALNPQMTIGEQIAEAVWVHRVANRAGARDRAATMLDRVGLSSAMMNRYPHQMSGGQRQRVVIARALILDPKLVVFDEAVSALDVSVQAQVVALLRQLWQELDLAYVFITHDLRIVRHLVDRIVVMYLGRVVETGDIKSVYAWPRHPYTRALLASVPTMDPTVRNIEPPIKGELDAGKVMTGCAFRSRCPFAIERCAKETPLLRPAGGQLAACHRAEEFPRSIVAQTDPAQMMEVAR
ncbi:ATP-binding cassette domain-containing protein [Agrobacterium rhizogenes]|uniref:ABC transporter, nucleotide binding/ATPase protein (Agrocinopine) n=14 Tax=Rhizobium/Agrobacterium group TaxID=227290 RepID=A0A2Z2PMG3_AGRFC|nr:MULTISPECIES: oligopeptide/dipeptide ABC transporter ATP-binding protein [Rhizobium/Agrobacterium group]AYD05052.1 peptide/nickel ABC transporter ATP-binding protein [Neorhizobium sp. NCHU2750]KAA6481451.1 ATP-binding cassette domain-containing protein [Agrobacterium sp. ICMP 7243]KJF70797.1 agrocinopine ABC transporter ATPase [Agrobacterium arsenijevicii]OCJ08422.1 dipeptide/oligopeptide/nickel ABC transporter ATP-binding protein [Agrobacterium sp. B131/95]OCJ27208.1 dipeptide/oligopeptide